MAAIYAEPKEISRGWHRGSAVFAPFKRASGTDVMRKQVFKRDLPNLNLDGWEVTALEIAFPPGVVPAKHRHPGFVLGYVLAGDFRFRMEGEQERIVHAGERFFESPDKNSCFVGQRRSIRASQDSGVGVWRKGQSRIGPGLKMESPAAI
jgi:quercetin dioxygenase-like cupin family protein